MAKTKSIDTRGRLWVEEGQAAAGMVAEVALVAPVRRLYSYAVPPEMAESVAVGQRVVAPVGRQGRPVTGFIIGLDRRSWDTTLRPIQSTVDEQSFLSTQLIRLGREIAAHYHCPLGRTLAAMTPEAVRQGSGMIFVRYVGLPDLPPPIRGDASACNAERSEGSPAVPSANEPEILRCAQNDNRGAPQKLPRMTPARRRVLDTLAKRSDLMPEDDLSREAGVSIAVIRGLVDAGFLVSTTREEFSGAHQLETTLPQVTPTFHLNEQQQAALVRIEQSIQQGPPGEALAGEPPVAPGEALAGPGAPGPVTPGEATGFLVTLIHGVSGSGKTELYIRALQRVLAAGRQGILLVPEIVLTTQLVSRLASRFTSIAVMHSGLTNAQRSIMWRQIASGSRGVIVGTRSAVFAPCPNLGILIVDEEQEGSFKNLQAPRFHVRDVAIIRGQQLGIPVVLGSATPSLETWYRSERRADYRRVVLSQRVNRMPMPKVHIVDMEAEIAETRRQAVLSRVMEQMLDEALARGEQGLLLMNRRGFANRIICPACHTRLTCPNCNVNLVVHTAGGFTICHYCRTRVPIPEFCPNVTCRERLVQMGSGTQRIEKVLAERFPKARIRRVDSDTMRQREDYETLVRDFEQRNIDVLVGTQMIAKGLDFPFVSFVGIVDADPGAFSADFRAGERLFQLITQVAGRAGRAETGGRVVVQTTMPDLPVLKFALNHDYDAFAVEELRARTKCGWPPFRRLARMVVSHAREESAMQEAALIASNAEKCIKGLKLDNADVLGPSPCVLSRIRGKYRYELLIRTANAHDLRQLLDKLDESGGMRTKASLVLDVDPVDLG